MIDNTDAYISVCEKANLPINKMPKGKKDLTLAYEVAMKELNPHLYQNIVNPSPDELPANVAKRYKQGLLWIEDLKAYEDCGFTGTAANIRKAMEQGQQELMAKKTAEMKARNDARAKELRDKPKGMQGLPPLSPESIATARAQWGITGLADWQK